MPFVCSWSRSGLIASFILSLRLESLVSGKKNSQQTQRAAMPPQLKYSRLSLSRNRRDPQKHFEISVLRHIRFVILRKKYLNNQFFYKWLCNLTPLIGNIYWKYCGKGEKLQFLLFSTIFCNLILDFCVKTRTRFSLRDKRLFEITEVEITRVNCIIFLEYSFPAKETLLSRAMAKSNKVECASSEDSDPPSLIGLFAVHLKASKGSKLHSWRRQRLC